MNFKKYLAVSVLALSVLALSTVPSFGQISSEKEKNDYKFDVSTSWLSLTNWIGDDIQMYELHFGYRLTAKDKIGLKAATWKLFEPMGIPYGPHKMQDSERYPGRLREFGIGITYQRMLWKRLFTTIEVMPMKKSFLDENNNKVGSGFRLYTSYHLGYHIPIFKNRFFIEPQIHCNYWPINSKGPGEFRTKENKWNNYFLFEPNLYIGVKF